MDLLNIYGVPILVSVGGAAGGSYLMNSFMHSTEGLPTWAPYVSLGGTAALGVYFIFPMFGIEGLAAFSVAFAAILQHLLHMVFKG